MANYSHAGDHTILQNVSPLATFLKLTSLGFIIGVGVVGNLLISILLVKDKSLHRAPYYFLLDLCASDILRSAICFPFVFTSVKNGSAWTYGTLTCKVIAFLGVLSCFHTAFMLFCPSFLCCFYFYPKNDDNEILSLYHPLRSLEVKQFHL
uniref:G protein-coupled receptor 85 n=1 Tax=Cyprinodon variegatus TaxID=28743 RepID=A0A3Q2EDQ4_CYPVA